MITNEQKNIILNRFLNLDIKCKSDNVLNKNFKNNNLLNKNKLLSNDNNIYMIIPKGIKSYIWFTYIENKNVCVIIKNNFNNNNNYEIEVYPVCFSDELSYGTILFGTFIINNNNKIFVCEDIFYYKNKYIYNYNYKEKLYILYNLFSSEIIKNNFILNSIIIMSAIINSNYFMINDMLINLPYKIYSIRYIDILDNRNNIVEKYNEITTQKTIFKVKASIQPDIYHLYCLNNSNKEIYYNVSHISSYKKSIYMNKLFRKIKENNNLDFLEESDSDSEFEDVRKDKFVDINKYHYMLCEFNKNFAKWEPKKILNNNSNLSNYSEIIKLERI